MSEPTTPTSQETKPAREIDEQTQKHIDRFLQGKEVWNKWANEMLAKKEELEKDDNRKVTRSLVDKTHLRYLITNTSNLALREWLDETFVDFSHLIFDVEQKSDSDFFIKENNKTHDQNTIVVPNEFIDFSDFIFPGEINFSKAKFYGLVSFTNASFIDDVFFSDAEFRDRVGFDNVNFQNNAIYVNVEFYGDVDFSWAKFHFIANFKETKFYDFASFKSSTFKNLALFSETKFTYPAQFENAKFQEDAEFVKAVFAFHSGFINILFNKDVDFFKAKFYGYSNFNQAKFKGIANFRKTKFVGNPLFTNVDFEKFVDFTKANFIGFVDFEAIYVKRAFNMSKAVFLNRIPNFNQANFVECPRLDYIKIIPNLKYKSTPKIFGALKWQRYFWKKKFISYLFRIIRRFPLKLFHLIYFPLHYIYKRVRHSFIQFFNTRRNPNEEAHYRALKRLAIQAHDHENEMKFFAGEIRARRHVTDFANFLTHEFASSARYWAGVAYELFSDFGRSFIRPILWWFACFWLFANLTLSGAGLMDKTKCHNSQLTPKQAAYTIGLKNSLLILGLTKTNIVKQAELCLYGKNKNGEVASNRKPYDPKIKRTYQAKSAKVENTKTDIPFKAAVQGIAHSLLSLLFIFLLLLAIRNQFKIK